MPSRKSVVFAAVTLALAALIGWLALLGPFGQHGPVTVGEALVGGPFAMTDQDGRRVTEKDFLGKYMLVFFGYTSCADVCPTELQVMAAAVAQLGADAGKVRIVFVSIDPGRDTPEAIKSYISSFGPQMTGLTGSAADVAAIARAYRVYYQKVPGTAGQDYAMDHSSIIYFMGPNGRFLKHFTYSTDARALAEAITAVMGN